MIARRLAQFALALGASAILGLATGSFGANRLVARPQAYAALDSPECIRAAEDRELGGQEPVLGVVRNGEPCAYPLRLMRVHPTVNDHLGGPVIAMFYCSASGAGTSFDPRLDGKDLAFDFHGYADGVTVVADRDTRSIWSTITGECLSGPRKGRRLPRVPTLVTTWAAWEALHPDSWVLAIRNPGDFPSVARTTSIRFDAAARESVSPDRSGHRPGDSEFVIGLGADGYLPQAVPYALLQRGGGVCELEMESGPCVVLFDRARSAGAGYRATAGGRRLTFRANSDGFTDLETGSTWTIEGVAIAGPLRGSTLRPVGSVQLTRAGWEAACPRTTMVGSSGRR